MAVALLLGRSRWSAAEEVEDMIRNRFIIATALAALGLLAPTPSSAGVSIGVVVHGDEGGRVPYHWRHDPYRTGYDDGYQEGIEHGRRDAWRHARFEFRDDPRYRCGGEASYRGHYGSRREYANGFRSGYEEGYRRGFYSRARWADRDRDGWDDRYERRDRYGYDDHR
jgi:hypothetical protein